MCDREGVLVTAGMYACLLSFSTSVPRCESQYTTYRFCVIYVRLEDGRFRNGVVGQHCHESD
ncbi:hypothetical protein CPB86DRAFT_45880 [Serendipita vermifera]|nr:hypothetical protein CPB86DRAFT_45880 [Serendipita vermifera]